MCMERMGLAARGAPVDRTPSAADDFLDWISVTIRDLRCLYDEAPLAMHFV